MESQNLQCPHQERNTKLEQEHNGITYYIESCDICAEIALKSSGEFAKVIDMGEITIHVRGITQW